jgi:hypothetical protein
LPEDLRKLFWDTDFDSVDLTEHRNFVIRRVLEHGDWETLKWLRATVGDQVIREWFLTKRGGGLDPRRLRFWGRILDLPEAEVDEWVQKARQSIWHGRVRR